MKKQTPINPKAQFAIAVCGVLLYLTALTMQGCEAELFGWEEAAKEPEKERPRNEIIWREK